MELKDFLKIIKDNVITLIILVALGAFFGFYSTKYFASGYHHNQTYFLTDSSTQIQPQQNVKSENFFSQEKAGNFTDSTIAILDSPDFKSEVLNTGDSLIVRKIAPQVIRLTLVSPIADSENPKLNTIVEKFNLKIKDLAGSTQSSELKAIGSAQPPSHSSLNRSVLTAAGSLLGILFAFFTIGVKNYFKL